MMKVLVVHDSKSGGYGQPWFQMSTAEAIRTFGEKVNDLSKASQVAKYPQDFTLFEIGEYDETLAVMLPYDSKKAIVCGADVLRPEEPLPLRQVT